MQGSGNSTTAALAAGGETATDAGLTATEEWNAAGAAQTKTFTDS